MQRLSFDVSSEINCFCLKCDMLEMSLFIYFILLFEVLELAIFVILFEVS
jgi:hypothetical protein